MIWECSANRRREPPVFRYTPRFATVQHPILGLADAHIEKIIPIFPHSSWLLLHELKLIDLNGPVSFVVGQITVKMSAFQRDFHGFNARLHLHLTGWTALHLAAAHGLEEVKWSCQRRSAGRICQMGSLHIFRIEGQIEGLLIIKFYLKCQKVSIFLGIDATDFTEHGQKRQKAKTSIGWMWHAMIFLSISKLHI